MDSTIPTSLAYTKHAAQHDVALVAIGNPLRGDDDVATKAVALLSEEVRATACILNAGSYTRDIPQFLAGHGVGIVIDAAELASGQPLVIDLSDPAGRHRVQVDCCHALSWLDELSLYNGTASLPQRLFFVGMPAYDTSWRQQLSAQLLAVLPSLAAALEAFVLQQSTRSQSVEISGAGACTKQP